MTTPVSFVKNSICSQKLTLSHFQLTCSSFQATISPLFGQNTWRSVLEEVLVKRTKRGNAYTVVVFQPTWTRGLQHACAVDRGRGRLCCRQRTGAVPHYQLFRHVGWLNGISGGSFEQISFHNGDTRSDEQCHELRDVL